MIVFHALAAMIIPRTNYSVNNVREMGGLWDPILWFNLPKILLRKEWEEWSILIWLTAWIWGIVMGECPFRTIPIRNKEILTLEIWSRQVLSVMNLVNHNKKNNSNSYIFVTSVHQKIQSKASVIIVGNVRILISVKIASFVGYIQNMECNRLCLLEDQITKLCWPKIVKSIWFENQSNFQENDFMFHMFCSG